MAEKARLYRALGQVNHAIHTFPEVFTMENQAIHRPLAIMARDLEDQRRDILAKLSLFQQGGE